VITIEEAKEHAKTVCDASVREFVQRTLVMDSECDTETSSCRMPVTRVMTEEKLAEYVSNKGRPGKEQEPMFQAITPCYSSFYLELPRGDLISE
jgi:hypothetical protein